MSEKIAAVLCLIGAGIVVFNFRSVTPAASAAMLVGVVLMGAGCLIGAIGAWE